MTLPLDTWRQILGYNPWHFWQQENSLVPAFQGGVAVNEGQSRCNTLVYEYAWQSGMSAGREDIRRAIDTAEERLFEYLGYRVGPEYVVKEFQYPRPHDARFEYGTPIDASGRWLAINAREGYIQEIGTEAHTAIDAAAAVVLSDEDGDGLNDTFTATAATALTDESEIAVYFAASDRLDGGGLTERWRIQPVNVSISGGTVTVTGGSWLLAKPIKYRGVAKARLDPNDATNFVTTVSIQRRYTDPTGTTTDTAQATFIWETEPPVWACPCDGSTSLSYTPNALDPAAVAYAIGRATIRNRRTGEIGLGEATYDADNDQFVARAWGACRQPDRVIIRYLAGANTSEINSQIPRSGTWDDIVARLAMAELGKPICACDWANQELYHWQFDLSRAAGANDEQYRISDSDLNCPLGTRRGAVYAWRQIKNLSLTRAFVVG